MSDLPMLKNKTIDTVYPLPIEGATKKELRRLKAQHRFDVNAWLRSMIHAELPKVRKKLESA